MMLVASPYKMKEGSVVTFQVDVDRTTLERIGKSLAKSEDVDDQDAAFLIQQALLRWP